MHVAKRENDVGNPIAQAIRLCGGPSEAVETMRVSRMTLWRWQKAAKIPNFDAAVRLARAVGWPVERLMSPDLPDDDVHALPDVISP